MTKSAAGLDQRQISHREVWEKKKALRLLYRDYHRQLFESCPDGVILDIGGGTAHIKKSRSDVISADILSFPGMTWWPTLTGCRSEMDSLPAS